MELQAEVTTGAAPMDKTEVQMVLVLQQQAEDDKIYRLYQICSALFSNIGAFFLLTLERDQSLIRYYTYMYLKKE